MPVLSVLKAKDFIFLLIIVCCALLVRSIKYRTNINPSIYLYIF